MLPSRYPELIAHWLHVPGSKPETCRPCADECARQDAKREPPTPRGA